MCNSVIITLTLQRQYKGHGPRLLTINSHRHNICQRKMGRLKEISVFTIWNIQPLIVKWVQNQPEIGSESPKVDGSDPVNKDPLSKDEKDPRHISTKQKFPTFVNCWEQRRNMIKKYPINQSIERFHFHCNKYSNQSINRSKEED